MRKGKEGVTLGTKGFFLACAAEMLLVWSAAGRRLFSSALIKPEATSGEPKPEIAHEKFLAPRVGEGLSWSRWQKFVRFVIQA